MSFKVNGLIVNNIMAPFDFEYHLNYYVIYPWIKREDKLLRILEDENRQVYKITVSNYGTVDLPKIVIDIESNFDISSTATNWIYDKICWCLGCDENVNDFNELIGKDPILLAAMQNKWGRRNKSTPTLFEGMMNVICAQNVQFSRIYSMSYNLASMFGKQLELEDGTYYSFPCPEDIFNLDLDEIKRSKVGYRAKLIKDTACYLVENKDVYKDIYLWDDEKVIDFLSKIKGVGPYTTNLVLNVALRRSNKIHLDSYVKEILKTFYCKSDDMDAEEISDFCNERWGRFAGLVIGILSTDTDEWARQLGIEMSIRSGANIKHNKVNFNV